MKAIAIYPHQAHTAHLMDVPKPTLEQIPNGRGVLVKVLRVGLDGTDREVYEGTYGNAPPGSDFLIMGHESLGVVEEVGPNVKEYVPGDYVVAMVRRPGNSLYDQIGLQDMTTDTTYHEHGINLLHGFLKEYYVDQPEFLVKIPQGLVEVGVLLEPTSVIEKGILQAFEIQRRLKVWHPTRAAVLGTGTIGLLASMGLRLRGIEVTAFGLDLPPFLNSELLHTLRAQYISTKQRTLSQVAEEDGPFDLIFECSGYSPLAFEAMRTLAKNGVLVLASVTEGNRQVPIDADQLNLEFVLGNRLMVGTVNASREDFEAGVRDLCMAQLEWPGWLARLLTRKVDGLSDCPQEIKLLDEQQAGSIKTFVEVSPLN